MQGSCFSLEICSFASSQCHMDSTNDFGLRSAISDKKVFFIQQDIGSSTLFTFLAVVVIGVFFNKYIPHNYDVFKDFIWFDCGDFGFSG